MPLPELPPTWVRFTRKPGPVPDGARVDRYRVERVSAVVGEPLSGIEPGAEFFRIESESGPPPGEGELLGVTGHLGYQTAAERVELAPPPPPAEGAVCVVIPISKSADWWALAHDERNSAFRSDAPRGHVRVGRPYANRVFRKLYNARYAPSASWDFLTYFEVLPEQVDEFRELVSGLRDVERNPEWRYVVHEAEIWMQRV